MIFRLSTKLATKIKVAPKVCIPLDANPFADWSAHLFTADRARYIIITNTSSLYSMVMHGRGISDDSGFLDAALTHMREFLPSDGNEFIFRRFIAPASGEVWFSKALSKAITGSMNDLVFHAKVHLIRYNVPPGEIFWTLNDMPMSYLDYKSPRAAFKAMTVERESP
jgi:hypothetical protein